MSKLLSLFVIPLFASILTFALPGIFSKKIGKVLAVLLSLLPLAILLSNSPVEWAKEDINYSWFSSLAIHFYLKVDLLSLVFLYLTAIIIPISLLSSQRKNFENAHVFYGFVLILQSLLIGFFTSRDLALFTIFWESMLIPLYFIITIWGGVERQSAALKFLVYMIAGSALLVAAVLALYFFSGSIQGTPSFNLSSLAKVSEQTPYSFWIFAIFALAFSVKTPLFPFHAWLPDVYNEAPIAGTILLSALLSKAGIYGFLRIGLEVFPTMMKEWSPFFLGMAIIGVLYGGLAAWMQEDYKRLIAYSSFSHVNFILAGIFVWNQMAHSGAILQAFNHGITIAALFLAVGWLKERFSSTRLSSLGGVAKFFPRLCWLTFIFVLSSIALPGTNTFIGELLILFGIFKHHPWSAALLGLSIILSVIYMLRWMRKIYFGPPASIESQRQDIQRKEFFIAFPLVTLIFWIGIYPAPFLNLITPAAEKNMMMDQGEKS